MPTLESHLDGRTDPRWLRGVAGLHPAEQVAIRSVLDLHGPGSSADMRTTVVEQVGTFGDGRWTVGTGGGITVLSDAAEEHAEAVLKAERLLQVFS